MGSVVHLSAAPSAVVLMGECMLDVFKKHNEICDGPKVPLEAEQSRANEKSENTESGFPEDDVKSEEQTPSPKVDLRPCMDRHPLPRIYALAPLLPVASAAMANAGLLFYARYLSTENSQAWYDIMFTMSRYNNKMIHNACGRPLHVTSTVPWDVLKYRLPALVLMVLARSIVRLMLSQSPFTWFTYSIEGGIRLLGYVDASDGPGTSPENKKHFLDRMLASIPPWVGTVISILNAVSVLGYYLHSRWQRRRQKQRNEQDSG